MRLVLRRSAFGLFAAFVLVALMVLNSRVTVDAPSLRATAEVALILGGLLSLVLVWNPSRRGAGASEVLALVAAIAVALEYLEFFTMPALVGARSSGFAATTSLAARFLVAAAFAAAAMEPRNVLPRARSRSTALLVPIVIGSIGLGLARLIVPSHSAVHEVNNSVLIVPAICLLLLAGAAFLRRSSARDPGDVVDRLLGAAAILLAVAWTFNLVVSGRGTDFIAGSVLLRVCVLGLVVAAALRVRAAQRRAEIDECIAHERRRLASLLHDGMAQDLAVIAAYESRLRQDLGIEHPVVLAARRALSAARGAIIDLSASDRPTATDALQAVADELSRRHGVRVEVDAVEEGLAGDEREAVVRIMREAVVNAVRHGKAKNITVSLRTDGNRLTMTIDDDGRGITPSGGTRLRQGYGLREMANWADQIGGQLSMQQGTHGGTAVTIVVS